MNLSFLFFYLSGIELVLGWTYAVGLCCVRGGCLHLFIIRFILRGPCIIFHSISKHKFSVWLLKYKIEVFKNKTQNKQHYTEHNSYQFIYLIPLTIEHYEYYLLIKFYLTESNKRCEN